MVRFEATAPRTPYSHFVRKEQLKPSLTAGFRNLGSVKDLLRVALVFLWLVWGLFMVDLGFIYMMFLKDYLQYENQKRMEKQRIGKA